MKPGGDGDDIPREDFTKSSSDTCMGRVGDLVLGSVAPAGTGTDMNVPKLQPLGRSPRDSSSPSLALL